MRVNVEDVQRAIDVLNEVADLTMQDASKPEVIGRLCAVAFIEMTNLRIKADLPRPKRITCKASQS
jgi:hypothetical protein